MHDEVQVALNFIISYLYSKLPRRRVNLLADELTCRMKEKFQGHWYPDKPFKGSAYRCIRMVDDLFMAALDASGLNKEDVKGHLPQELTLWIDPGEVSYRISERGVIKVIYRASASDNMAMAAAAAADVAAITAAVTAPPPPLTSPGCVPSPPVPATTDISIDNELLAFNNAAATASTGYQQNHHAQHDPSPPIDTLSSSFNSMNFLDRQQPQNNGNNRSSPPQSPPSLQHAANHANNSNLILNNNHRNASSNSMIFGKQSPSPPPYKSTSPYRSNMANGFVSPPKNTTSTNAFIPKSQSQPMLFTAATFAQTKFGSTKSKHSARKPVNNNQRNMSPTEFSQYIKQRAMLQQLQNHIQQQNLIRKQQMQLQQQFMQQLQQQQQQQHSPPQQQRPRSLSPAAAHNVFSGQDNIWSPQQSAQQPRNIAANNAQQQMASIQQRQLRADNNNYFDFMHPNPPPQQQQQQRQPQQQQPAAGQFNSTGFTGNQEPQGMMQQQPQQQQQQFNMGSGKNEEAGKAFLDSLQNLNPMAYSPHLLVAN